MTATVPQAITAAQAARARRCPLCQIAPGRPRQAKPADDHLARYLDAYTAGQLSRTYMAAVVVVAALVILSRAPVWAWVLVAGDRAVAGPCRQARSQADRHRGHAARDGTGSQPGHHHPRARKPGYRRDRPESTWATHGARLPPMSFHKDFWVVVGTAAPVIVLAVIITAADSFRFLERLPRPVITAEGDALPVELDSRTRRMLNTLIVVLLLAIGSQTFALSVAVVCLARERDTYSVKIIGPLLPLGILLTLMAAGLIVLLRSARYQAEQKLIKQAQVKKTARPSSKSTPESADPAPHEDGRPDHSK